MITLEAVLKDVERVTAKFSTEVPENEYEMKSQLELCKVSQGHTLSLKQGECFPLSASIPSVSEYRNEAS